MLLTLLIVLACINLLHAESEESRRVYNIEGCVLAASEDQQGDCNGTSLEEIASNVENQQLLDVQINIRTPEIVLYTRITFANLSNVNINGESVNTTIVCCGGSIDKSNDGAGIVLHNITDTVTLNNLTLLHCGSKIVQRNKIYSSALTLVHCENMEFNQINITQSDGIGLMMIDNTGGNVSIKSSSFTGNKLLQEDSSIFGGGGMYIQIVNHQNSSDHLPTIHIVKCTFENNTSRSNRYQHLYTNSFGNTKEGYGRGGGVSLDINTNGSVHVSFVDCTFIGNEAFIGGGLSVNVRGQKNYNKENIIVQIVDSLFKLNGCNHTKYTYFGGGIRLTIQKVSFAFGSVFLIKNVSFIQNCAELGGGLYFLSDHSRQTRQVSSNNSVSIDNCTFAKNQAHMGSAVSIDPTALPEEASGYMVYATFKNCYFLENRVTVNNTQTKGENQKTAGLGTIRASQRDIYFEGNNCFKHNNGTAVYVINGIVNFQNSNASFINNFALFGGAMVLIGSSTMIVGPNKYEFFNNSAVSEGGAIHISLIDSFDFTVSKSCFIQYTDENNRKILSSKWNANITFAGNRVHHGNTSGTIYATSLHYCRFFNEGTEEHHDYIIVNVSEVFIKRGITIENDNGHELATDGAVLHTKQTPLEIIPGENYKHGVELFDDFGQMSPALFGVTIRKYSKHHAVELDSTLSPYVADTVQLTGNPSQDASLILRTKSSRGVYIGLDVTLLECPPGFKHCDVSKKCVCNIHAYVGLFKCDRGTFQSYLLHGYWAGYLEIHNNDTPKLVTSTCPFCEYRLFNGSDTSEFEVVLPRNSSDLDKTVCGETRTGVLCGKCREGYTVHFHSPGYLCKPAEPVGCKLGWLFYILSELVPVTVVFITVLVLNVSFTSGGVLSSFILFSQLLDSFDINASGITTYTKSIKQTINTLTTSYQFLYGFFNMNFFDYETLSFCLWENATILEMLTFKYVTILYILLLIVSVIWFMNKCGGKHYCGKCCRITTIRTSIIHGISSFLVICYTKLVYVSILILNPVHFHVESNSGYNPRPRIWMNGEIEFFSKQHLPYALPALFSLLTIGLLPPVLFLSYPLLNKVLARLGCEDSKAANFLSCQYCVTNLKPLLDSFQSCFKDNMRFLAGLYFIYRWTVLFVYVVTRDYGSYYTVVGCVFLGILVLHMVCQPYIKREHNIIDTLLLANLVLINSLSFYNYHQNYYQRGVEHRSTVAPAIIQLILIHLPLVVICTYVLVYVIKKVIKFGRIQSLIILVVPRSAEKIRKLVLSVRNHDEYSDSNQVELVHDDIEYESYTRGYFREPNTTSDL